MVGTRAMVGLASASHALGALALLACVTALSSCAPSRGSLGVSGAEGTVAPDRRGSPGIVVIGTTGPLRPLQEKDRAEFHAALGAGVETLSVPGIMSSRVRALVPDSLAHDARGDLVAARSNIEGLLWVERVLCRNDASYRTCAGKYRAGVFDTDTGRELGRDRAPKRAGALIDVSSYLALSPEESRHSASELDARAGQHCDCNRALPGSVQSSVPIPQSDR